MLSCTNCLIFLLIIFLLCGILAMSRLLWTVFKFIDALHTCFWCKYLLQFGSLRKFVLTFFVRNCFRVVFCEFWAELVQLIDWGIFFIMRIKKNEPGLYFKVRCWSSTKFYQTFRFASGWFFIISCISKLKLISLCS